MSSSFSHGPATVITFLVATMATLVEPHMIMATPKPYGFGVIDNSPLTSSNYPCKVTSDPATFYKTDGIIDSNTMVAGENQTLSFTGSAVHGGGSCQLAISSDMQPTAETSWRVILSIESGCPSKDGSGPSTYDYTIPADLTPGQYSFAWTWISKLAGQPEYYMNCAPIIVTAGKTKRDEGVSLLPRDDSWPEMFVGNLADINSCKSTGSSDPEYPFPGPRLEKLGSTPSFASVSGSNCVAKGQKEGPGALPTAGGGGSGGDAAGTTAEASASASTSASATASSSASQQSSSLAAASPSQGGIFAPSGSSADAGSTPSPTTLVTASTPPPASSVYVIPVTPSANGSAAASSSASSSASSETTSSEDSSATEAAPSATDSASSSSEAATTPASTPATTSASSTTKTTPSATLSPTGGGGSGSGNSTGSAGGPSGKTGTCNEEGVFNCIGTQYQQCASGVWTAMRALPGGTTCKQGESQNLWARDDNTRSNRVRKLRWNGKRWVSRGV